MCLCILKGEEETGGDRGGSKRRQRRFEEETGDGSVSPISLGKRRHRTVPCLLHSLSPQKRENDADKGNLV